MKYLIVRNKNNRNVFFQGVERCEATENGHLALIIDGEVVSGFGEGWISFVFTNSVKEGVEVINYESQK